MPVVHLFEDAIPIVPGIVFIPLEAGIISAEVAILLRRILYLRGNSVGRIRGFEHLFDR